MAEQSMDLDELVVVAVWCATPIPPRASPARIASLARAPLRFAKGAVRYASYNVR